MVAQVAWQNDLAEGNIQRSITFLPMEIRLLSLHHCVSLEKTFHLVYYMVNNIEYENLACYHYKQQNTIFGWLRPFKRVVVVIMLIQL
jgi:hypothetical protein